MENDLYKVRSFGGCLKAAYDIFSTNLKHIFRRTWLPAVIFAVLSSITMIAVVSMSTIMANLVTPPPVSSIALGGIGLLILFLVTYSAYAWFYTSIISLLNGESFKHNLPRMIRLVLLILGIGIVFGLIVTAASTIPLVGEKSPAALAKASVTSTVITSVLMIVFVVVILPLSYSMMKYCIETKSKLFSVFKKPYIIGWKHWGYIFIVTFLCGIILLVIDFIASLPLTVTTFASSFNSLGLTMGDPSGLPGYFNILSFIAGLISTFIMIYVSAWYTCVAYYVYGHIEAKEKAKKEMAEVPKAEETSKSVEPDFEEIR